MRTFMIVVPDELVDRPGARGEGKQWVDVEALVVNGPKEPFDFAIRLGRIRPQQVMANVVGGTHLLKAGEPRRVKGIAHGEREGVVGQHRFDAIWQRRQHVLEECRRGRTGLVGMNRYDGFATEIVDRRKFVVIPGVSQRWRSEEHTSELQSPCNL